MKQQITDNRIDIMKCIGCFFILFSHSGNLLGEYKKFAFGGMFGNAIFFFCSGFFLFREIKMNFTNWYKKRIIRVYPSLFAFAIILAFLGLSENNMKEIIINGGGWFVSCIMIHYIIVYILCKYLLNKLKTMFFLISIITIIWFILGNFETDFNRVPTYFRYFFWFLFTLFGGIIGKNRNKKQEPKRFNPINVVLFSIFILTHYILMYFANKYLLMRKIEILALVPLFLGIYYFYNACNIFYMKEALPFKYLSIVTHKISALSLEIYILQITVLIMIDTNWNKIFPLNIVLTYAVIIIGAYILKIASKIFLQTFSAEMYDWREIINL